jgi:hypothetical protein
MSDLQCPARVYLARNDLPPGRVRSAVEGEQIAAEYAVPPDHPVDSAWLDDIIDRHRGEAVLVVAPVAVITGGCMTPVDGSTPRMCSPSMSTPTGGGLVRS